jgi:uncharacterized membrane protein YeaQ/YmgE (transglycosylase-associated protein family)
MVALLAILQDVHFIGFSVSRSLLSWIVIGLIAGWLAGTLARGRGYGCIVNIILGMIGAVLGGWIFTKLNIAGGGWLYSLAAATVGAVILVGIARLFSGGNERD